MDERLWHYIACMAWSYRNNCYLGHVKPPYDDNDDDDDISCLA